MAAPILEYIDRLRNRALSNLNADSQAPQGPVQVVLWLRLSIIVSICVLSLSGILLSLHYVPSAEPVRTDSGQPMIAFTAPRAIVDSFGDTLAHQGQRTLAEMDSSMSVSDSVFTYPPGGPMAGMTGVPTNQAYESVMALGRTLLGSVLKAGHEWATHLLIVSCIANLIVSFWFGLAGRRYFLRWLVLLSVFGLSLASTHAGHIIQWSALSAASLGATFGLLANGVPGWMADAAYSLFGASGMASDIGPRFYALHSGFYPGLLVIALVLLWRIERRLWPHIELHWAFTRAQAGFSAMVVLMIIALVFVASGPELPLPMNPFNTGTHDTGIQPRWYFLAFYGLLKSVPFDFAFTLLCFAVGWLVSLPLFQPFQEPGAIQRAFFSLVVFIFVVWSIVVQF